MTRTLRNGSRPLMALRLITVFLTLWVAGLAGLPSARAQGFVPADICPARVMSYSGTIPLGDPEGAEYVICEPDFWLGGYVIFSHGTVRVTKPPGKIEAIQDQLESDGVSLPALFTDLGFVFVTVARLDSGFSKMGLAKKELKTLASVVKDTVGDIGGSTYLVGASQGGLFTTILVEKRPDIFDGGLAACAPIGKFRKQIKYFGNLLVAFDYFFPEFNLLEDLDIPQINPTVFGNWEGPGGFEERIRIALKDNPDLTRQIRDVAEVASDPTFQVPVADSIVDGLETALFMIDDSAVTLGGNPFGNQNRVYSGSDDDVALNLGVKRYSADREAKDEIQARYETSGDLSVPLVTLHTVWDPIVPFWHEELYLDKTHDNFFSLSALLHSNIPVNRYGHCAFEPAEAVAAFALLVLEVEGLALTNAESVLPDAESRMKFRALSRQLDLNR